MERYLKRYDNSILMERSDLEKLTKEDLIELLLKKEKKPKVVIVNDTKPKRPNRPPPPIPEGVKPFKPKQTVKLRRKQEVVDDRPGWVKSPKTHRWVKIDGPTYRKLYPMKHRPGWIRSPRTNRWIKIFGPTFRKSYPMLNMLHKKAKEIDATTKSIDDRYKKVSDVLVSSPKITQLRKALKGSTKSFTVDVIDNEDPLHQLNETKNFIKKCLVKELLELKGFKYIETLKVTFEKKQGKGITTKTAFFNSKTKTLINAIEINEVLQSSREELVKAIAQWLSEGSGWTISSVENHFVNLTQYQPLKGGSYLELPTELKHPNKGLINLQNKDDCCFAWCHVRHLHPQEKNPQRIEKSDNAFIKDKIVNYDGIEFPVTIKDYNKIEKMNSININVFCY